MKKIMFALVLFMSLLAVQEVSAANLTWVTTPAAVGTDVVTLDVNPDPNILTADYNFNSTTGSKTHTWVFNVTPASTVSTYFSILIGNVVAGSTFLDGNLITSGTSLLLSSGNHTLIISMSGLKSGSHEQITIEAAVPVPAAIWLFGSALVGLVGVSRRKVGLAA